MFDTFRQVITHYMRKWNQSDIQNQRNVKEEHIWYTKPKEQQITKNTNFLIKYRS